MNTVRPSPGWRTLGITAAVLVVLLLFVYRETTLYVLDGWNRWAEYYSHGYLTLAISLYLVYLQRRQLAMLFPCASPLALIAVAASCLMWLLGALADVLILQTMALLLILMSVIWSMLGGQAAKSLVFPLMVIVFALPVWSPLTPLLQELTIDATFGIVRLLDVPAYRQGQVIILPAGRFSVEEGCSGAAYLLAALTLGSLYAYLNHHAFKARFLVVAISAAAAIAANILRVVAVVHQGYVTGMQTPLIHDHFYLGWLLYGGLVLALLSVDMMFFRRAGASGGAGRAAAAPVVGCHCGYSRYGLVLVAAPVLLVAAPVLDWQLQHRADGGRGSVPVLPAGASGWSGPLVTQDAWMPVYHGAVVEKGAYHKGSRELFLYVGYYPVQKQGSELIYYLNRISNEDIWKTQQIRGRLIGDGNRKVIEQVLKSDSGKQRLVWYWYRVGGLHTSSTYMAKGLQVLGLLTGKPYSAVIAVATDYENDAGPARRTLAEFLSVMGPMLARGADGQSGE